MYIQLPFKFLSFYRDKSVDIVLNIGTLEAICDDIKIEFWELDKFTQKDPELFMSLILYFGYITSCQKHYKKPKFTKTDSIYWVSHINATESAKLVILVSELFGKVQKASGKAVKKK